jgi:hypothetical protein
MLRRATVSATKKHNVERHFKPNYNDFDTNFHLSPDVRKKSVCDLKVNYRFKSLYLLGQFNNPKSGRYSHTKSVMFLHSENILLRTEK